MTGTVLDNAQLSTTGARALPQAPDTPFAAGALGAVHGLVAIANGPDYCLCGRTWPCARRAD